MSLISKLATGKLFEPVNEGSNAMWNSFLTNVLHMPEIEGLTKNDVKILSQVKHQMDICPKCREPLQCPFEGIWIKPIHKGDRLVEHEFMCSYFLDDIYRERVRELSDNPKYSDDVKKALKAFKKTTIDELSREDCIVILEMAHKGSKGR